MVYVEDVDARVAQAVAAGAKLTRPVANQFYGDRTGGIEDPFGYHWYIATHVEDVPPDELERRAAKAMARRIGMQQRSRSGRRRAQIVAKPGCAVEEDRGHRAPGAHAAIRWTIRDLFPGGCFPNDSAPLR